MNRGDLFRIVSTLVSEGRTLEQAMSYGLEYSKPIMEMVKCFKEERASSKEIRDYINQLPESRIEAMPRYKSQYLNQ